MAGDQLARVQLPLSRIEIAGAGVDRITFREALARIIDHAKQGGPPAYVVTPNAHHVSLLRDSELFRRIYDEAWLALPDGISLVWAARLLGKPLPERVSGSDLFPGLCKAAVGTGLRIFLFGGREGAAEDAARILEEHYPGLHFAGTYFPPFGFDADPIEKEKAIAAVRAASPDILFVALGAPKQEIWMYENRERLGVPVLVGVGAAFDLVAGFIRRAPKWMRKAGLEWFHRALLEPRRLGMRYAKTNPRFIALVLRQYLEERRSGGASTG